MTRTYRLGVTRRTVNKVMTVLVKAGINPKSTYLLTTTGRHSGQPRSTPVVVLEHGADRWLVAPYGAVSWVHNLRANPSLELRHGRRRERLRAEEVDAATAGPVLHHYVQQIVVPRPFFDAGPDDPDTAFAAEAARHPVFRLTGEQD